MNKKSIITALLALVAVRIVYRPTVQDFWLSAFNQIETLTSKL